jgi:hypothetical protein
MQDVRALRDRAAQWRAMVGIATDDPQALSALNTIADKLDRQADALESMQSTDTSSPLTDAARHPDTAPATPAPRRGEETS